MDIPIELFATFIAITAFIFIIGIYRKLPVAIVASGLFLFTFAIVTDNIIISYTQITDTSQISETTIANTTTIHYQVDSTTAESTIGNFVGTQFARGILVESSPNTQLHGDTVQCISIPLKKTGSPTGNATIGVYDSMNENPFVTIALQDVSLLTTSFVTHEYCLIEGSEVDLVPLNVVGIKYKAGDSTNNISIQRDSTDPFTGAQRAGIAFGATTWAGASTDDITARLYDKIPVIVITEDFTQTVEPNIFEFTEMSKVLFALVAITIILIGGLYQREL